MTAQSLSRVRIPFVEHLGIRLTRAIEGARVDRPRQALRAPQQLGRRARRRGDDDARLRDERRGVLGRVDTMAQTLERLAKAIGTERGLLHALIYTPEEETLGRLTRTLDRADALLKDVKDGPGMLHALIYDREGAELIARLGRTSERLDVFVGSLQEGKGLVPSLLFDPERVKVLDDLQAAAGGLRALPPGSR